MFAQMMKVMRVLAKPHTRKGRFGIAFCAAINLFIALPVALMALAYSLAWVGQKVCFLFYAPALFIAGFLGYYFLPPALLFGDQHFTIDIFSGPKDAAGFILTFVFYFIASVGGAFVIFSIVERKKSKMRTSEQAPGQVR